MSWLDDIHPTDKAFLVLTGVVVVVPSICLTVGYVVWAIYVKSPTVIQ